MLIGIEGPTDFTGSGKLAIAGAASVLILATSIFAGSADAQDQDHHSYASLHEGTDLASWVSSRPDRKARPHIIYIMLDDAGWGDFGAFGSEYIQTPTMDRLAREGMRFTSHYAGAPVCAPARCVLMTGKHAGHCRRRDNVAKANLNDFKSRRPLVFLDPSDRTVAEALKGAGYTTAGIGKWGLGNDNTFGEPTNQGFDHWFGYLDQVHAHDYYPEWLWDDGKRLELQGNKQGKEKTYSHDLFEERTLSFVRNHQQDPFFLYLAYTLPHSDYVIPHDDPSYEPYRDKPWAQKVRNYAAMVTRADRTVGKLIALLEEQGMSENTIVFYTSDNGPNRLFAEELDSNGPFQGIKRSLHEGGIRVPMVVWGPGRVPAGRSSDVMWGMRDFFPTALDLAGVDPSGRLDGTSVLPLLLGRDQRPHEHLYWEYHSGFQQAVRMGKWKGMRNGTEAPLALYDLTADPGEEVDLSGEYPDIVQTIETIMDTSRTPSRYWPARKRP